MLDRSTTRVRVLSFLLLMTFVCVGCGGPYYVIKGSMQAKTLILHDGKEEIKIDLSTAMGGGLAGDAVDPDGQFVVEQDGVRVEGSVDPTGRVKVKEVTYKDKKVGLGSMGADI